MYSITGPIGRDFLPTLALALAVWIPTGAARNRSAANCKVCGCRLPRGEGTEAMIADGYGKGRRAFLCADDLALVRVAHAAVEARSSTASRCRSGVDR